jgi:hypothetical protein
MLDRLGAVRVGDELRLRGSVWVVDVLTRGVTRLDGLGGNLPLRHAGRELDEVVLLACAIPLRDPARWQVGRGVRGTLGAG